MILALAVQFTSQNDELGKGGLSLLRSFFPRTTNLVGLTLPGTSQLGGIQKNSAYSSFIPCVIEGCENTVLPRCNRGQDNRPFRRGPAASLHEVFKEPARRLDERSDEPQGVRLLPSRSANARARMR